MGRGTAGIGLVAAVAVLVAPVAADAPSSARQRPTAQTLAFQRDAVQVAAAGSPAVASAPPVPGSRGWIKPSSRIDRIVLVGDSLAQEISPVLQYLTAGKAFVPKFWGGTAPCDWATTDLAATRSSVVVVTFTGNSLTPCMSDGAGGFVHGQALVDRYRYDLGVIVDRARQAGARVVLVGQPYRAGSFDADDEVDGINEIYRSMAAAYPYVSFVDAGAQVETPDGKYAERLPCSSFDVDCAPDGTTVIRGDGVHFCPHVGHNPCDVWSSGAFRFGLAVAGAANKPQRFD